MPEKTIRQQPVTLSELNQVSYVQSSPGSIAVSYSYTPVDENGNPVGEKRAFSSTKSGIAAEEIRTWLENEVLPEINEHEGT
jgi:hypothetical protein